MNIKNRISQEKYYMYTVVAGTIQLIKLSLPFSIYMKVFFYRVERVSK